MYIMTVTRPDGSSFRMLASGWTEMEREWQIESWCSDGCTVTFGYGVWR